MGEDPRRTLPSVEQVLEALRRDSVLDGRGQLFAAESVRRVLAEARAGIGGGQPPPAGEEIIERVKDAIALANQPTLRRVINATGVILQTNLGRAPLSERAIAAMAEAARGYTNLEFDLEAGARGSRHEHVRELIRRVTGAEDGIVVNNNAAAVFMALQVFAAGREVLVSRGQAVEIGGGFRIPDVLRQSGARLVEVGTTNRTYARDYAHGWTGESAAILRVHASNFKVVGFTSEPSLQELVQVAHERGGLLLDDAGSGCLLPTEQYGMAHEPMVQESIAAGVDLAMFSGDKLVGGPQCGIIAGRAELVAKLRDHPLARALRVDKLTIAALDATLRAYAGGRAAEEIPVWRMVAMEPARIRRRAAAWAKLAGANGAVVESRSMVGGGSVPGEGVPSWCAAFRPAAGAGALAARLRSGEAPILGRVTDGALLLDPRTIDPKDDRRVTEQLSEALSRI